MARIRTIKPEFPQSETVGRLSRDARLLFVQLWTIVDDSGRTRAASRMLASLLYPYDDDAPSLIEGWLAELEREGCIRRYEADGTHYLDLPNWLEHQKIDRPTPSRLPEFQRALASPREPSATDLGPRTVDQDRGPGIVPSSLRSDGASDARGTRWAAGQTMSDDWLDFAKAEGLSISQAANEFARFTDYWVAQPGAKGRKADWPATWRNWIRKAVEDGRGNRNAPAAGASAHDDFRAGLASAALARMGPTELDLSTPQPAAGGRRAG